MKESQSTTYWAFGTERVLECPIEQVWPIFADTRSWYTEYTFTQAGGPTYQAGIGLREDQVFEVSSAKGLPRIVDFKQSDQPEYFVQKVIKVIPSEIIVSLLSGEAYDWQRYVCFYVWRLNARGPCTRVQVECYGEAEFVKPLSIEEMPTYRAALESNWRRSWSEALQNLAQRCEPTRSDRP